MQFAIALISIIFSLIISLFLTLDRTDQELYSVPQNPIVEKPIISIQNPVRLKIPKINIDAEIDSVGINAEGDMQAPSGPKNTSWYKLGPRPGENGNAVIAGHFGVWKNGEGSVFDDLSKLNKGDIIYVEDELGQTNSFIVSETKSYEPNADASEVFISDDAKSHLNLITCSGVWNKDSKSYSTRFVVFTDLAYSFSKAF